MTFRQAFLKVVYPMFMWLQKIFKINTEILKNEKAAPPISFYSLKAVDGYGNLFDFAGLKGKKVLIVNTASDCGYTRQYEELQQLHEGHQGSLVVLAFPANNFGQQENGSNEAIASFCKTNYHITFPVMSKSNVVVSAGQTLVYNWLTNEQSNGWNSKAPSWNFSKYLIDEEGKLIGYFGPSVSPLSDDLVRAIETS